MNFVLRQRKLREWLEAHKVDALLVTHLPNVRYLCGFTGSAGILLVTRRASSFFTDGRYTGQARAEVKGARIVVPKVPTMQGAAAFVGRTDAQTVGVEAEHMTVATRSALKRMLPAGLRLRETQGVVEELRKVKDPDEVSLIREAVIAGSKLMKPALNAIHPGASEQAVAAEIEYAARSAGAEAMSFETIVASGVRSALPHGVASSSPIARKGFVVLDFGVILQGYCSDMTRTVHVGKVGSDDRRMYEAVLEAQLAAVAAVAPGVEAGQVDAAARSTLRKAKLDKYFTHSTGHGVGLEIHEKPRIGRGQRDVLVPGMVITIEPGVYVPGRAGVRIEDMVVVTERGCQVLTPAAKDLIEL